MRILLENSGYDLLNYGDLAMLQVAVVRLRHLFSDAQIGVLTSSPERLAVHCPDALPVPVWGRDLFFGPGTMLGRFHKLAPGMETLARNRYPQWASRAIQRRMNGRGVPAGQIEAYQEAVCAADLVIATGGGYLTDAFPDMVRGVTRTLRFAARQGKPLALLGQGLGPLENKELSEAVRGVLPDARFISLREGRSGPRLLERLNYPAERILVTGDDAIESAHTQTPALMGDGIGVSIRATSYSGVDPALFKELGAVLSRIADTLRAPLIPVPISFYEDGQDARSLRELLGERLTSKDGGATLDSPLAVMREASKCRIVVTGSYHAGVFALSQGIPVVALNRSSYYQGKFDGLAHQFGTGCAVIALSDADWATQLTALIPTLYRDAETLRPALLESAARQIAQSREAYARLPGLVKEQAVR